MPADYQPLLERQQKGLQMIETKDNVIVAHAFEKASVEVDESDSGGAKVFVTDIDTNDARFMYSLTPNAAAEDTVRKAEQAVRKKSVCEEEGPLSISMTTEDLLGMSRRKKLKHEDGSKGYSWNKAQVNLLSVSVLKAWEATKEEELEDNLWFIYLLNHLLGLVALLSDGQLSPTLGSIMSFNTAAKNKPGDQALHLDINPRELYPDLVKDDPDGDGYFVPQFEEATLDYQLKTLGETYYPTVFLYFVAFDHEHAIKVYNLFHGTDVLYKNPSSAPSTDQIANDSMTQTFIETVKFPFGSIGIVAGSVIHCGVGSDDHKTKPRFRMHSFCHVTGQQKDLNSVYDTYIWQKD